MSERNLSEMLSDRVGIAFGNIPRLGDYRLIRVGSAADSGAVPYGEERCLEALASLDFALLDTAAFYLSNIGFVLHQLNKKLIHHGLLLVFQSKSVGRAGAQGIEESDLAKIIHKVLVLGAFEFVTELTSTEGTFFVFRSLSGVKSRASLAVPLESVGIKPLRYKLADSVNDFLSRLPGLKLVLKGFLSRA